MRYLIIGAIALLVIAGWYLLRDQGNEVFEWIPPTATLEVV